MYWTDTLAKVIYRILGILYSYVDASSFNTRIYQKLSVCTYKQIMNTHTANILLNRLCIRIPFSRWIMCMYSVRVPILRDVLSTFMFWLDFSSYVVWRTITWYWRIEGRQKSVVETIGNIFYKLLCSATNQISLHRSLRNLAKYWLSHKTTKVSKKTRLCFIMMINFTLSRTT